MGEKINASYLYKVSLIGALGGFLFGFDTAIVSGTISFVSNQFSLSPSLTGWYVSSALVGCLLGVAGAGYFSDKYGRKNILQACAILFIISALGCATSIGFADLIVYRIIGGLAIGIASMTSPIYISEISPAPVRGRMVALYQFAITAGILISYLINAALLKISLDPDPGGTSFFYRAFHEEVWRMMLGSNLIPALIFLVLLSFVPESPRWLVLKGNEQQALKAISKISDEEAALVEIAEIKTGLNYGPGEANLFSRKGVRLAIVLGVALGALTQISGINVIIYYGPKILNEAGLALGEAFGGQVIIGIAIIIFTLVAIWKIDSFGRKPLLVWGISGILLSLFSISALFAAGAAPVWIMICILSFVACFSVSYGPVVWVLLSELYPNAIRGRAMAMGTMAVWVTNAIIGQLVPVMLAALKPSGTFLVFAVLTLPAIPIIVFLVPETKGRTLEEIEKYWLHK
jgi:sugar porter (SP) family MFS transporter